METTPRHQLFLWQGIIIYAFSVTLLFWVGNCYKEEIIAFYFNSGFNQQDLNPVSNTDRLMVTLENKIQENPTNPNDYLQLGWIYYQKGADKEAIKVFLMALNLQPDHAGALYNIGSIYLDEKDYNKAETYFKKILAKHPEHELAGLALIKVYYNTQRYQKADNLLTKLNPYFITSADYFYYQGLITEKMGRSEEAVLAYKKALSFDPNFTEAKEKLNALQH